MRIAGISSFSATVHPMRRAGDSAPTERVDVALVPVTPVPRTAAPTSTVSRPDPSFVAQLIATAEQDPQTRVLRRAAVADVDAAYRAGNQNQTAVPMGIVTRRSA
jgi:hypothetical protein